MIRQAGPALVAGLVLLGCVSAPQTRALRGTPDENLPRSARVPDVPIVVQRTDECGPAALATMLRSSGVPVEIDPLVEEVYLPGRDDPCSKHEPRWPVPLAGHAGYWRNPTIAQSESE